MQWRYEEDERQREPLANDAWNQTTWATGTITGNTL